MVKIVTKLTQLRYSDLMAVYEQSNRACAAQHYGALDANDGLIRAEQELYAYLGEIFFERSGAFVGIWEENGEYVSAVRMEPYLDGLLLNGLETAPEHRNKGYAQRLVAAVLQDVRLPVYSHVHKENGPSLRVHRACGFSVVGQGAIYLDGTQTDESLTLCRKSKLPKKY